MLSDRCQSVIDEALTALGNTSKLSKEAIAHIEICPDCRRSLEAIKALKASTPSVIPVVSNLTLKNKIASSLEKQMLARSAVSSGFSIAKPLTILTPIALVLGIGAISSFAFLSNSSKEAEISTELNSQKLNNQIATDSKKVNFPSSDRQNQDLYKEVNQELFKDGYQGDLRNFEQEKHLTQTIPPIDQD